MSLPSVPVVPPSILSACWAASHGATILCGLPLVTRIAQTVKEKGVSVPVDLSDKGHQSLRGPRGTLSVLHTILTQAQGHLNPPVCSSWPFGVRVTLEYFYSEHSDHTCVGFAHMMIVPTLQMPHGCLQLNSSLMTVYLESESDSRDLRAQSQDRPTADTSLKS